MQSRTALVLALALVGAAVASGKVLHTRTVPPTGWAVHAPAEADHPVTFIVALKQQNLEKLDETFWAVSDPDSPRYRKFLQPREIQAIVRPSSETRTAVLAWLSSYVSIDTVEDLSDAYKVKTTVEVASQALNTEFIRFRHHATGKTVVRQMGDYSVPAKLDAHVDLVAGVSEFPDMNRLQKRAPAGFTGVVPQTLNSFYNPSSAAAAGNASVGVIEWEGQYFSTSDLSTFSTDVDISIPALSPSHIVGTNDPNSPGDEADLDIQWALATGNGATGWFWINGGSAWLYGFATAFMAATDVPSTVSMSYGWSETQQCQAGIGGSECQQLGVNSEQYVKRVNTEFQKIGVRGVSLFASSGDSGANGRTDGFCTDTHLNPTFPAASPYVTAVGATQVNSPQTSLSNPPPVCSSGQVTCISSGTEVAVSYDQANFASGGGFSAYSSMPSYQTTAVQGYLSGGTALPPSSYYNAAGRAYPDIAAFGSAMVIVDDGSVTGVGGTSCSSPLVAGYFAKLSGAHGPLGFVNPLLYKMPSSSFNDITVGDNICTEDGCSSSCKGYKCATGWDPVTGLGSPNYGAIDTYLTNNL